MNQYDWIIGVLVVITAIEIIAWGMGDRKYRKLEREHTELHLAYNKLKHSERRAQRERAEAIKELMEISNEEEWEADNGKAK